MTRSLALARPWLGQRVTVHVDRPLGSRHPRWGFVYEVNYGYLPGVIAPDGEELAAVVRNDPHDIGMRPPRTPASVSEDKLILWDRKITWGLSQAL